MDPILETLVARANRSGCLPPLQPYSIRACKAGGFVVTNQFGAEYWVQVRDREPVSCTCPSFKWRGPCKHMTMLRA